MDAFSSLPLGVFLTVAFVVLVVRYGLFTSVAWAFAIRFMGRLFPHKKIQARPAKPGSVRREIAYSVSSMVVFALTAGLLRLGSEMGVFQLYRGVATHGWIWIGASLVILMVLHDAYFWLTHRLLHTRWLFRHVHVVHHRSTNPTPFAAFAFHPVEAVVQAGFILLAAFILPLHVGVVAVFVNLSLAINILGHLGFEFYPASFIRHWAGRWLTTSTHHNLHHQKTHGNYGLYFTWWDVAARTLRSDYASSFRAVSQRSRPPSSAVASCPADVRPLAAP